jgi:FAD/FMN-containing dehydrogenase
MAHALRNVSEEIHKTALEGGQNVSNAAVYTNYALYGTPLEQMYGGNVERLRAIRAAVDPNDVMGLTGGWKF